jgi:hypothetical protein
MSSAAIEKYLARYAEPEARRVPKLSGPFYAALMVPAFAESEALLDGYRSAARAARGRVLLVLVVNAPPEASAEQREANAVLLRSLGGGSSAASEFVTEREEFTLLVVDRASLGREIAKKLGVGHARKIGSDIILAVAAREGIELPFVFSTDADVTLPSDYFERAERTLKGAAASALLYPFEHVQTGNGYHDVSVFEATLLYELSLRYHVLGLSWARSTYAYHSVGSTIAAHIESYTQVRGFPKRAAGEDFYLLDKLGKVLPIEQLTGASIQIRARRSLRVPFGTGPRVEQLLTDASMLVDHPDTYRALGTLIRALDRFAEARSPVVLVNAFAELPADLARAATHAANESGLLEAARSALAQVGGADLRRRMHTWFDGLRSLRFLHTVADHGFPKLPCREALAVAPFAAIPSQIPLRAALDEARRLERTMAARGGPAAFSEP